MKTKNTNKKKLISKIVTVVCLVATLVAVMVVPSFAWSVNSNTGKYTSQTFEYELDPDNPEFFDVGVETMSTDPLGQLTYNMMVYSIQIPISNIDNFPNVTIRCNIEGGLSHNRYTSFGDFTCINAPFTTTFYYGNTYFVSYRTTVGLDGNVNYLYVDFGAACYSTDTHKARGGELRLRFSPSIESYQDEATDIISNKNTTISDQTTAIMDRDATIESKNQIIREYESGEKVNEAIVSDYKNQIASLNSSLAEKNKQIASLQNNVDNNSALRSLFNGIGDGISKLIEPFLDLEFNGITIGSVVAFVVVLVIVFIVLKFVI